MRIGRREGEEETKTKIRRSERGDPTEDARPEKALPSLKRMIDEHVAKEGIERNEMKTVRGKEETATNLKIENAVVESEMRMLANRRERNEGEDAKIVTGDENVTVREKSLERNLEGEIKTLDEGEEPEASLSMLRIARMRLRTAPREPSVMLDTPLRTDGTMPRIVLGMLEIVLAELTETLVTMLKIAGMT